jgi:hypothetical protein
MVHGLATQVNSNHSVPGRNNSRPNSCNRYSEQRQARLQFLATQQGAIQIIATCTDDANLQISDWFLFIKLTHLLRCEIKQAHGCLGGKHRLQADIPTTVKCRRSEHTTAKLPHFRDTTLASTNSKRGQLLLHLEGQTASRGLRSSDNSSARLG